MKRCRSPSSQEGRRRRHSKDFTIGKAKKEVEIGEKLQLERATTWSDRRRQQGPPCRQGRTQSCPRRRPDHYVPKKRRGGPAADHAQGAGRRVRRREPAARQTDRRRRWQKVVVNDATVASSGRSLPTSGTSPAPGWKEGQVGRTGQVRRRQGQENSLSPRFKLSRATEGVIVSRRSQCLVEVPDGRISYNCRRCRSRCRRADLRGRQKDRNVQLNGVFTGVGGAAVARCS